MNITVTEFEEVLIQAQVAGEIAAEQKYEYLKKNHEPIFDGLYDSMGGLKLYLDADISSPADEFLTSLISAPLPLFKVAGVSTVTIKRKKKRRFRVEMKYGAGGYGEVSVNQAGANAALDIVGKYLDANGWSLSYSA